MEKKSVEVGLTTGGGPCDKLVEKLLGESAKEQG